MYKKIGQSLQKWMILVPVFLKQLCVCEKNLVVYVCMHPVQYCVYVCIWKCECRIIIFSACMWRIVFKSKHAK